MTKNSSFMRQGCPIRYASAIFGDKWSLMIIRDLLFKNRRYYGEFLEAGEGISTNILADRLVSLEKNGVIQKQTDPIKKSKNIYSLTEKGLALMPIMLGIINWSEKYDQNTDVPKPFITDLRNDPDKLQQALLDNLSSLSRTAPRLNIKVANRN